MSYCGECYYSGKKLKPCMNCYEGSEAKTEYTNADRIRSMTDEELAELFAQYSCEDADYASLLPIDDCLWGTKREVIGRNLNWLQSEVEGVTENE